MRLPEEFTFSHDSCVFFYTAICLFLMALGSGILMLAVMGYICILFYPWALEIDRQRNQHPWWMD